MELGFLDLAGNQIQEVDWPGRDPRFWRKLMQVPTCTSTQLLHPIRSCLTNGKLEATASQRNHTGIQSTDVPIAALTSFPTDFLHRGSDRCG